ncbi:L-threonylcarbamoyladenylate synthase [Euryhalocaulis caribicus]|uniref:L-threonylcarbamoyladenylate synthase n=1 Tax=Euryhalocaulis caribicus TaxID=1161401 RepID=UPI0003A8E45B|nr:L-threonylcarbamoyladenylate synthase [Euryhalocaulis caribicus]
MTAPVLNAADPAAIARAAEILRGGGLVAMPTETVYGLAADAANPRAVAGLYAAKGRPRFNPLIAHVGGFDEAARHGQASGLAERLAAAFWPGPLTLVLPARPDCGVCDLARAGLDTVALRAPAHPAAQSLLTAFGGPLVAPSANPSETISPTTAAHVVEGMGEAIDLILDGGPCRVGVESTVVAVRGEGATLLRPGGLSRAEIEAVSGPLADAKPGETGSPGMLRRHYAPNARLRLNASAPEAGEAYLGFGPGAPDGALNLSPEGDLAEAAANLFSCLRRLDSETGAIAVAPVPEAGLGEAINDRLRRAAG